MSIEAASAPSKQVDFSAVGVYFMTVMVGFDVATAVIAEATLVEQPRTKELEYRIIAINKAGEGEPSNTEMVVL